MKCEWEDIAWDERAQFNDADTAVRKREYTDRLAVPGGWLYREQIWLGEHGDRAAVALCFVPGRSEE